MKKLVRDLIPRMMEAEGMKANITISEKGDEMYWLTEKLNEEFDELFDDVCVEEFADIVQVLIAIGSLYGINFNDVIDYTNRKHVENGGFTKFYILDVDE